MSKFFALTSEGVNPSTELSVLANPYVRGFELVTNSKGFLVRWHQKTQPFSPREVELALTTVAQEAGIENDEKGEIPTLVKFYSSAGSGQDFNLGGDIVHVTSEGKLDLQRGIPLPTTSRETFSSWLRFVRLLQQRDYQLLRCLVYVNPRSSSGRVLKGRIQSSSHAGWHITSLLYFLNGEKVQSFHPYTWFVWDGEWALPDKKVGDLIELPLHEKGWPIELHGIIF